MSTGITAAIDNYVKNPSNSTNNVQNNELKSDGQNSFFKLRIEKFKDKNGNLHDIDYPTGYAAPMKQEKRSLAGYLNPLTKDNRIYTAEDIGEFSKKEFKYKEPEIDAQLNSIGIPCKKDLHAFGNGTIYIAPYTRSDGIQVKGHYRSLR